MEIAVAFDRYCMDADISERTREKLRHQANRWLKIAGESSMARIDEKVIITFRRDALAKGLSAATIEDTISDLLTVFRSTDGLVVPSVGKRLKRRITVRSAPSVSAIGAGYAAADTARWPSCRNGRTPSFDDVSNGDVWRGFLVVGYYTGLRLEDVCALEWSDVGDDGSICTAAGKTGHEHRFPACSIVNDALSPLRAIKSDRVFPFPKWSAPRIRRELARLHVDLAPQALRRASITSWACSSPEAGRIVHGCGLGVLRHYYQTDRILAEALQRFPWPVEMRPPGESSWRRDQQDQLLAVIETMKDDRLADILRIARSLTG